MAVRYLIRLPDPAAARGPEPALSFRSDGADGLAGELQEALRSPALFKRWLAMQPEPDDVDPGLGATDPAATVTGQQKDLKIELVATTSLPGAIFKHRMRLLAGANWELADVRAG